MDLEMTISFRDSTEETTGPMVEATVAKTEVIEETEEKEATMDQIRVEEDSRDLKTGKLVRSDPITSSAEAVVAVNIRTTEMAIRKVAMATRDRDSKEVTEDPSTTGLPNHSCPCLQMQETPVLKQSVWLQTSLG